jgi:hypothetical protein
LARVLLAGSFDTPEGAVGAELLGCEVTLAVGGATHAVRVAAATDRRLEQSLAAVLELVRREAGEWGLVPPGTNFDATLTFPPFVKDAMDASYGLGLYAGILAELWMIPTAPGVSGTGSVDADGRVSGVAHAALKHRAALEAHVSTFVVPAANDDECAGAIPVSRARMGAMVWLGVPFLTALLGRQQSADGALACIEDFAAARSNQSFPDGLSRTLRESLRRTCVLQRADAAHRARWIHAWLSSAWRLPSEHFRDVVEILGLCAAPAPLDEEAGTDPAEVFERCLAILASNCGLLTEAKVADVASLFEVASAAIDVGQVVRQSPRILPLLRSLADEARSRGVPIANRLAAAVRSAVEVAATTPVQRERLEHAALQAVPRYEKGRLTALDWYLPDRPGTGPQCIANPAALLDRSLALPEAWRRTDWELSMSALDQCPEGGRIGARFGLPTVFRFDSFLEDGLETRILWQDGTGVWPPSIDTLHLAADLAACGIYGRSREYARVLDLGCGTGVHGLLLARNCGGIDALDFVDVEPGARVATAANALLNLTPEQSCDEALTFAGEEAVRFAECRARFFQRRAEEFLRERIVAGVEPYDLVVCTPPYVPGMEILADPGMWRAVAGTDLLRFVLSNWARIGRKVVLQFATVALADTIRLPQEASCVGSHYVGFRIPPLARFFDPASPAGTRRRGRVWMERVATLLTSSEDPGAPAAVAEQHHGFRYFMRVESYLLTA